MPETFLVIGGTGRTGRRIVALLRERGHTTRVLSRHASGAEEDLPGVQIVHGDITDPASVRATMVGVVGVVVIVESSESDDAPDSPERVHYQGTRNVLDDAAAATARAPHIVLVTQIYVTRPDRYPEMATVIRWRARAEEAVRAAGWPYTIVRPSWLTDAPGGQSSLRLDQGDRGDGRVSRADVAEVCVRALLTPSARGTTFEVYNEPGPAPGATDWPALFAALAPDLPAPAGAGA